MSLRTALLPALNAIDQINGPAYLDMRPTTLTIVTRTWPSGQRRVDSWLDDLLPLPNWTRIRHVSEREIAGSGGLYEQGDLLVGPIRPRFRDANGAWGGFTQEQLAPVVRENGTEIIYRVELQHHESTGVEGDYARIDLKRDKALRFMLVIGRERTTP